MADTQQKPRVQDDARVLEVYGNKVVSTSLDGVQPSSPLEQRVFSRTNRRCAPAKVAARHSCNGTAGPFAPGRGRTRKRPQQYIACHDDKGRPSRDRAAKTKLVAPIITRRVISITLPGTRRSRVNARIVHDHLMLRVNLAMAGVLFSRGRLTLRYGPLSSGCRMEDWREAEPRRIGDARDWPMIGRQAH
jgi:hypothetical protein